MELINLILKVTKPVTYCNIKFFWTTTMQMENTRGHKHNFQAEAEPPLEK